MDGADHGAAGVDGVAHRAHDDGRRPRVQAARRLILRAQQPKDALHNMLMKPPERSNQLLRLPISQGMLKTVVPIR